MPSMKHQTEMLRYFRDQTSGFEEELFRKAIARIANEGLKADEMETSIASFSEDERRKRFGAVIRGDISERDEFRYVLVKEIVERRMMLIAARTERHDDIQRPAGTWKNSGGGFLSFDQDALSIDVHNRSWSSALASDTTENYLCIRACLENYVHDHPVLSSLDVKISISKRQKPQAY